MKRLNPADIDWLNSLAVFAMVFFLTGCATPAERVVYRDVFIPVSVPCAVKAGPEKPPIWTAENVAASPHLFALGHLLYAALLQEQARNAELRAAIEGCSGD